MPWLRVVWIGFGMERTIEKGAALDGLAADSDRQGVMPRGGLKERADRVGRLGRLESDRGFMGPGGAVVRDDMGRITAEEVCGLQHQAVARPWVPAGEAPAQRAAPARESEKAEPGGVLRLGDAAFQLLSPKVNRTPGSAIPEPSSVRVTRVLSPSCSMVAATRWRRRGVSFAASR